MKKLDLIKAGVASVGAFAVGMGAMYLFDPDRGAKRRAHLRARTVAAWYELEKNAQRALHQAPRWLKRVA